MTLTVKAEVTKEIDIPIPCFLVNKEATKHLAILDEKTFVKVVTHKGYTTVSNSERTGFEDQEISEAWTTFHSCTELQFLEAYDKAIESMSLHPVLTH